MCFSAVTAAVCFSAAYPPRVQPTPRARLRLIPKEVKELMDPFKAGQLPGNILFPHVSDLEAEQARLEASRPAVALRPVVASADAFPTLGADEQCAVVQTLVKARRRGQGGASRRARWTPDRLGIF